VETLTLTLRALGPLSVIGFTLPAILAQAGIQPGGGASTYELWVAALAILTSLGSSALFTWLNGLDRWQKQAVVAGIAGVLAIGDSYYRGVLDLGDASRTWIVVFLGATTLYHVLIKPTSQAIAAPPLDKGGS
jgi:hypothetical protein